MNDFLIFPCGSVRWIWHLKPHSVYLPSTPFQATVVHYFSSETRFFDQQLDSEYNRVRHELLVKSEKSEQKPNI